MSFTDILLLKKFTRSVISITAAVVALLGGWILISAFSSEPETRYLLKQLGSATNASRSPNAISGEIRFSPNKIEVPLDLKVETFNIGCLKDVSEAQTFKSSARQVRLKTQFCDGSLAVTDVSSIVNRTNGYVATLFNLERGGLSTDYIGLAEGQNQILLQIEDGRGRRATADVTILRHQ